MNIESRTLDGQVFISVTDTAAALRARADDFDHAAEALGEPLVGDDFQVARVYRAVAMELGARADWLDVATISHLGTTPD